MGKIINNKNNNVYGNDNNNNFALESDWLM